MRDDKIDSLRSCGMTKFLQSGPTRMDKRFLRTMSTLLVASVWTMACSKAASDKPADTSKGAAATATPSGAKMVIAVIGKSSDNPVFLAARTGAEEMAKKLS